MQQAGQQERQYELYCLSCINTQGNSNGCGGVAGKQSGELFLAARHDSFMQQNEAPPQQLCLLYEQALLLCNDIHLCEGYLLRKQKSRTSLLPLEDADKHIIGISC